MHFKYAWLLAATFLVSCNNGDYPCHGTSEYFFKENAQPNFPQEIRYERWLGNVRFDTITLQLNQLESGFLFDFPINDYNGACRRYSERYVADYVNKKGKTILKYSVNSHNDPVLEIKVNHHLNWLDDWYFSIGSSLSDTTNIYDYGPIQNGSSNHIWEITYQVNFGITSIVNNSYHHKYLLLK